jgi:LysR family transcriptional regulator, hca operon transcriptional activator
MRCILDVDGIKAALLVHSFGYRRRHQRTHCGISNTAPSLQVVVDNYLKRSGMNPRPAHSVDNLAMAMSLIASTRGVALLPAYAKNFLPRSVTSRPLDGEAPTIDLVIGYSKTNTSPILGLFLSRVDKLKKVPKTH